MLNKEDFKNHIKTHLGYVTEDFICKFTGIKKYILAGTADWFIKNHVIDCRRAVSTKIDKNGSSKEYYECSYNLIDTLIILGRCRKTAPVVNAIKLCKEFLHA